MVYYRCKMNHIIEPNKYAKEFYCGICREFNLKSACEVIKIEKKYNAGMVKKRVPANIIIEQPKIVVQHKRRNK